MNNKRLKEQLQELYENAYNRLYTNIVKADKTIGVDNIITILDKLFYERTISASIKWKASGKYPKPLSKLLLLGKKIQIRDYVEPKNKSVKSFLEHRYVFDAKIVVKARDEVIKVIFSYEAILSTLQNIHANNKLKTLTPKNKLVQALIQNMAMTNFTPKQEQEIAQKLLMLNFISNNGKKAEKQKLQDDFIKKVHLSKNEMEYDSKIEVIEELLNRYAFLDYNGQRKIIDTTQAGVVYTSLGDLKTYYSNKPINGKNPVDIWLNSKKRITYNGIKFDPTMHEDKFDNRYNIFKGFKYIAKDLIDISMFKSFVKDIICSGDEKMFNIVWSFLAQMLQDPTRKMGTALVLLSKKGTGKSTFVKAIGKLLDGYFMQTADHKRLVGEFNKHLAQTLLFYANELTFTDNKKVVSKLKNIITETEFTYEAKRVDTVTGQNYTRIIIDSNDDYVVVQTEDERRFIYPVVSDDRIGDTEYFNEVHALMEKEGFYETLMFDLMNFDYKPFEHYLKVPPKNEITEDQIIESLLPIESWWKSNLESGEILGVSYRVEYDGRILVTNEAMFLSFCQYCRLNRFRNDLNSATFGKALKKYILKDLDLNMKPVRLPKQEDGKRPWASVYETREKCIQYFMKTKKLTKFDWDGKDWYESSLENAA